MKSGVVLHRPLSWKPLSQLLVFWTVTKLPPHAVQCIKQFLKLHVQCTRDHTRGLLKASASIAESAVHPLEHIAVVFAHRHSSTSLCIVSNISNRFTQFREADSLHGHNLSRGLWSALLIENHAQARED